jgi:hypothetical protein
VYIFGGMRVSLNWNTVSFFQHPPEDPKNCVLLLYRNVVENGHADEAVPTPTPTESLKFVNLKTKIKLFLEA